MDDIFERICDYEIGELSYDDTIELFQDLVDHDLVEELQGTYERVAQNFINAGLVTPPTK